MSRARGRNRSPTRSRPTTGGQVRKPHPAHHAAVAAVTRLSSCHDRPRGEAVTDDVAESGGALDACGQLGFPTRAHQVGGLHRRAAAKHAQDEHMYNILGRSFRNDDPENPRSRKWDGPGRRPRSTSYGNYRRCDPAVFPRSPSAGPDARSPGSFQRSLRQSLSALGCRRKLVPRTRSLPGKKGDAQLQSALGAALKIELLDELRAPAVPMFARIQALSADVRAIVRAASSSSFGPGAPPIGFQEILSRADPPKAPNRGYFPVANFKGFKPKHTQLNKLLTNLRLTRPSLKSFLTSL